MILSEDRNWKYARQLTIFGETIESLRFAWEEFLEDPDHHCVIREMNSGVYAVFVEPQYVDQYDRDEVQAERYILEDRWEAQVVPFTTSR